MATPKKLNKSYRTVKVVVTKEIIETAEQRDSNHCMIVDAIKMALPEARQVSVDLQTIRFSDPKKKARYIYLTPEIAQAALIDFDQGVHNEEFTFYLRQAVQVVEATGDRIMPDGNRKRASYARQSVEPARGERSAPVVIGGTPLPLGPLAAPTPNLARVRKSEPAAVGEPPTDWPDHVNPPGANITLAAGRSSGRPRGKKRLFGIRQLRP